MKKKRMTNREFFERHRDHFERSDQIFRDWLARYEARRKADAARGESEEDKAQA